MMNINLLEEVIKKYEAVAEKARTVFDESTAMAKRINGGLERLDQKITDGKTAIQVHKGNIVGNWVDDLIYDNTRFREQILTWEAEIDAHRRFLQRAPIVRGELNRLAAECGERIKDVKVVEDQLSKLCSYQDKKNHLRQAYSDGKFFELADLVREINAFESELFSIDFLPFFAELKGRYHSEPRVLTIPAPDADDTDFEKFWKRIRYESLRYDLLSRKWSEDVTRGENLIIEMRILANDVDLRKQILRDYNDSFFEQLKAQNSNYQLDELR